MSSIILTVFSPDPLEDDMADHKSDPIDFLPLHALEFRILLVLLDGPAHGYRIVKEVEARESEISGIYPGNLYRRIRDLLSKGLLEDVAAPAGVDADPRRRYFNPTSLGTAVARAEGRRLEKLLRDARAVGVISGS
jgi:DNA-binding PadR family transcriptional regulator